ncbi:FtsB family cell division protein [Chitinophaga lutea]
METKKRFAVPRLLRNKYLLVAAFMLALFLFFDRNNVFSQYQLFKEIRQMESQKEFYQTEIDKARQDQFELLSSPEKLEKFAREQYRMKKDDEDLFIVPTTPAKSK